MADLTITAANVAEGSDAKVSRGTSGAAVTAGQAVALNASNQVVPCDPQDSVTHKLAGVAVNSAPGSGQRVNYVTQSSALNVGATLTIGTVYVVGAVAGSIAPAADLGSGDYAAVVGIAETTSTMRVNITSNSYVDAAI